MSGAEFQAGSYYQAPQPESRRLMSRFLREVAFETSLCMARFWIAVMLVSLNFSKELLLLLTLFQALMCFKPFGAKSNSLQ